MYWEKKGLIFVPDGKLDWSKSHAQVPIVEQVADDTLRVFYSTRDAQNQSAIGSLLLDAFSPLNVKHVNPVPVLQKGKLGTFDDCGVMPTWLVDWNGKKYLYYIGWNIRNTIPYHNAIGIAVSEDGGENFTRLFEGPVMDRIHSEPYFCGTACILIEPNNVWRNWYLSCTGWEEIKGKAEPKYHLKYAESLDGINWVRKGQVAIDYKTGNEGGIVKASVIKEDGIYKMWYSYRDVADYREESEHSYRIGYAESTDGIEWKRLDSQAGIDISREGWDSQMLAYPHVIDVHQQRLMFYNGNGFGKTGFGYAIMKTN